jgi:tripartite ATP-independent transporter DctM subunit
MFSTLSTILVILLTVLFIGTPVAFGLGFVAVLCTLIFLSPDQLYAIGVIAFSQSTSQNQIIAPLFILMAEILSRGGVAADMFVVLSKWMSRLRGGLAISATLAATMFAALCGSSPATAAAIGRISIKEMTNRGYTPEFSTGVVAAGGTIGIMIPPSMAFVIFGIITETSIAKLFIAGILPGLLISALLCTYIIVSSMLFPQQVGQKSPKGVSNGVNKVERVERFAELLSPRNLLLDFKIMIPPIILISAVIGTLYTGIATATEASGVGAIGAFLIIIILGRLRLPLFFDICAATSRISVMIAFIIIGGLVLSYVVTYIGVAHEFANFIVNLGVNRWVFFSAVMVLWLIMGCLLDPTSMIVMTIPFLFSTFNALGFDPLWVGVVSTLAVEIGMITPPVGLNLFVLTAITDIPMKTIIKGVFPFTFVLLGTLVFLILFPGLATYLPSKM